MPYDASQECVPVERVLQLLKHGKIRETRGGPPWGSNYIFLVDVSDGELEAVAIYKPRCGERSLWDFPSGTLFQREYAAFVVSEALGWGIVPPTVLREGPHGIGAVQLFIEHDPSQNYFTLGPEYSPQLRRIALFDQIINNADRKGGHCLLGNDKFIWSIDHGVCFHAQPKLRTVIWDFAGEAISEPLLRDICQFAQRLASSGGITHTLRALISLAEIGALRARVKSLLQTAIHPAPGPDRRYPWPPI